MSQKAIIVDMNWCYGCHTCEVACQTERNLPIEQTGIKVLELGTWSYEEGGVKKWQKSFTALPTNQCDACVGRLAVGESPTCVRHCLAACLKLVDLDDIKPSTLPAKTMLYALG